MSRIKSVSSAPVLYVGIYSEDVDRLDRNVSHFSGGDGGDWMNIDALQELIDNIEPDADKDEKSSVELAKEILKEAERFGCSGDVCVYSD
jgi:hypothetical protein